jgi:hypothetical protein
MNFPNTRLSFTLGNQLLNNEIINKTLVNLPQPLISLSDAYYPSQAFGFSYSQRLKLFGFPILDFEST